MGQPFSQHGNELWFNSDAVVTKAAEIQSCDLASLALEVLKQIDERVYHLLSVDASVRGRTSYGGTAPVRVCEQIAAAKEQLELSSAGPQLDGETDAEADQTS